jgi:hypothetical protein
MKKQTKSKRQTTAATVSAILISGILMLAISGCQKQDATPNQNTVVSNNSSSTEADALKANAIKISATELFKAYMENRADAGDLLDGVFKGEKFKADETYKGKTCLVTGTVDHTFFNQLTKKSASIYFNIDDARNRKPSPGVVADLAESDVPKVGTLQKNQEIKVLGKCDGVKGGIKIINAVLVD